MKTLFLSIWYHCSPIIPRKLYLMVRFRLLMGYALNLNNPKSFSEKLQWLKIYAYRPEYSIMVDKVKAKDYVASIIGPEYIIPTLRVWKSEKDIDFSKLPNQFVLKCNHNSGTGMYVCTDKTKMDEKIVRRGLRRGLRENYYYPGKDLPYKYVERRILAEQYMVDEETKELRDYKFFCFDGVVKAMFVATGRSKGDHEVCFDFFDENYKHLNVIQGHPNAHITPERPTKFDEMKLLASKLSKGIPHVRVDFYEANGKVYFGEMTFYHFGGMMPIAPIEFDYQMGEWINLPKIRK